MTDPGDELVEVVDLDGAVTGIVTRRAMRTGRLRHRATFIAVLDDGGRLLIHQRSATKDLWPSRWDIAAGGVAAVGESWEQGATRELHEELGLSVPLVRLQIGVYEDSDVSTLGAVFYARLSPSECESIAFDDGEVVAARWVTFDELDALLDQQAFCPDSLQLVLPAVRELGSTRQ